MATKRKTGASRGKVTRAATKPAKAKAAKPASRPKASAVKAKASKAKATKPAAARATRAVAKPAPRAAKPVAKPAGKPAAKAAPRVVGKPAVPGKGKAGGKVVGGVRKADRPAPEVRPLGVLPPESRARVVAPPPAAPPPKPRPRPMTSSVSTTSQGVERVTEKDYQEFQTLLLERRSRILKEMGHLESTVLKVNPRDSAGDLSGYSFHMADAGTDAMEREKAFYFASSEGRALMEIDDALRRLHRGEYGVCESCGNPIARERLVAIPDARLCVPCKTKEEKAGRGIQ
jgi:RNA polymerase-binding transcription factor DksA